jgi:predicted TIM-barrel fold metal-dependent hydrolase
MASGLTRREALRAALGTSFGSVLGPIVAAAEPVRWSSGVEPPKTPTPPNTADCHHHIYDSRYPISPNAALRPADATVEDYRNLQKRLGTSRNVIVQPSTYGTDNRLLLDSLRAFGRDARGIAVVDTSVTDAELEVLNKAGVRGLRFIVSVPGGVPLDMLEPLSSRVDALGWHVQIVMTGDDIVKNEALLKRVASPMVFDHMGQIPQPGGTAHPAFAVLSQLIEKGRTWIKLSGPYTFSALGAPNYDDAGVMAKAFIRMAPERLVWGTDWPHPTEKESKPDDAHLLDLFASWASDENVRRRILVINPEELYGFGKTV